MEESIRRTDAQMQEFREFMASMQQFVVESRQQQDDNKKLIAVMRSLLPRTASELPRVEGISGHGEREAQNQQDRGILGRGLQSARIGDPIVDRVIPGPSANNSPRIMPPANLKKTVGRRRIPIQKIEKKQNRQVTFTKRKAGLFRKASELSTLCGSEIAVIVFSNAGKPYACGNPSVESVFQRYTQSDYDVRKIRENAEAILWENRVGKLGLNELKLYANYLRNIRDIISAKATSMASQSGYVGFDDVNWEDIESAMADSPLISPDCFTPYEAVSSLLSPGGCVDSDILPSSSSCLEVDTQFDSSLCDIQMGG